MQRGAHSRWSLGGLAGGLALCLLLAPAPAGADQHVGYYYPPPQTIETYQARAETLQDSDRSRRIGFVVELTQQFVDVVPHQGEQQFLIGADVIVERARLDPDLGGKLSQAHGRVAVLEDQAEPRLADRLHRLRAVRADRPRHDAP